MTTVVHKGTQQDTMQGDFTVYYTLLFVLKLSAL